MSEQKPTRRPLSRAKLKSPPGEDRGRRRTSLLLLLLLLLVPICLCVASEFALFNVFMNQANQGVGSRLAADYATSQPQAFNPLNPELIGTIRAEQLTFAANSPALGTLIPFGLAPGGSPIASLQTPTPTGQLTQTGTPSTVTPTATTFLVYYPATDTATVAAGPTLPPFYTDTPIPPPPPTPIPLADLSITKTDGVATLAPGGGLIYTIVVTNNGPAQVANALVQDAFPLAITSATWICVPSVGSNCDTVVGVNNISATVDLLVTGTATFTVTVTTDPAAAGTLINTATVTPPPTRIDPNPANNVATDTDTFTTNADLEITKSDSADPIMFGSTFSYTITVTNHGPNSAANVIVTDSMSQVYWLPPTLLAVGPTVNSVSSSQGGCSAFPCNLGTLLNGGSATINISVTANRAGIITNNAAVSSDATDPGPFANATSDTTDVRHKIVIDLHWLSTDPLFPTFADLDLSVVDASLTTINRFAPNCDVDGINCVEQLSPSNGLFSGDVNCSSPPGPDPTLTSNDEAASWTSVGGPAGTYSITANYYRNDAGVCSGSGTIAWSVTVTVDNVLIQTYSGSASGVFSPPTTTLPGFPTTCTIGATVSCP